MRFNHVLAIIWGAIGMFKGIFTAGELFETGEQDVTQGILGGINGILKAFTFGFGDDFIDDITFTVYDMIQKFLINIRKKLASYKILGLIDFGDPVADEAKLNAEKANRDQKVAEKRASKESAKASEEAGAAAKDATAAIKQSSAEQLGLATLQTENARTINDRYLSDTASKVNVPGAINTPASTTPSSDSTTASSTSATKTTGSSPTDIVGALNTLIKIAQDQLTELHASTEYAAKIAKQSNISAFANVTNKNAMVRQSG